MEELRNADRRHDGPDWLASAMQSLERARRMEDGERKARALERLSRWTADRGLLGRKLARQAVEEADTVRARMQRRARV